MQKARDSKGRVTKGNRLAAGHRTGVILRTPEAKLSIQKAIFETTPEDIERLIEERGGVENLTLWERTIWNLSDFLAGNCPPEQQLGAMKLVLLYGVGQPVKRTELSADVRITALSARLDASERAALSAALSGPGAKRPQGNTEPTQ